MISVSRVPRVPHSHEAKFRHKANPAVAFPQISAVGRSVAEARYDRRQSARAAGQPELARLRRSRPAKRDVGTAPPAAPPPPAMSPPLASPAPLHSAPQPRVPRRATDTAEERRAARARHDAPGAAHLRPTKSSSRHTIAPLQRSSSRVSDRSRSPPPNFDDADSRRGGQPLDNDAGSDSDEPDDPCESPFYGGLGGLSPW
ncbi:hypothetical protein JL720_11222 [Aureococcus anophagefferens]|nr:hypothetical protein JL720_11222 [Aureococcus anophagefferens]